MCKSKIFLQVAFFAIFIVFASCSGKKSPGNEPSETEVLPDNIAELRDDQVKLVDIQLGQVEMKVLSGKLKVSGMVAVAPQNLARVCMPLGGFVKTTSLIPGNSVQKGQVLAVLENQEFVDIQQNYFETKSKYEFAEAEFNRHSELYKDDVYSKQNLQQVTSDFKILKVQLKALEQKLALIGINPSNIHEDDISRSVQVIAPISGYVKAVNISIGQYVSPSDVLFEIVNNDKLLLELSLFEKDADKVSVGQKIKFFINNETEQHEAVIYQTGKSINADKTYKVYASVPGTCKNVLPGMYVNAIIEASDNKVAALPDDAIVSFDDKDYIFIFEKDKEENGKPFTEYRMIEVQKGISDEGFTEVIFPEGFPLDTAKVVIKGAYDLLSAKKNAGEMAC